MSDLPLSPFVCVLGLTISLSKAPVLVVFHTCTCYFDWISVFTLISRPMANSSALWIPGCRFPSFQKVESAPLVPAHPEWLPSGVYVADAEQPPT